MATLLISLDERLARRLLNLAASRDQSVEATIDELLRHYHSQPPQAAPHELVGAVSDGDTHEPPPSEFSPSALSLLQLAGVLSERESKETIDVAESGDELVREAMGSVTQDEHPS